MADGTIIFEHPLNDRMRNLLRLETLLMQAEHSLRGTSIWDSRSFIGVLMEILDLFGRIDLKTELIKELERAATNLGRLEKVPGVDGERLEGVLERLAQLRQALHGMAAQLGHDLRGDPLLSAVRQRSMVPGGTAGFDLPLLHRWLHEPAERRMAAQEQWFETLSDVRQSAELLLRLVRNSAEPESKAAENGAFQTALEPGVPYQIIRVYLPDDTPYYVEVSGGRNRIAIRFMEPMERGRPAQTESPVRFQLASCVL